MNRFKGQLIYVDNDGTEASIDWKLKPTKDTVTATDTAWSSGKIQMELNKKANNASVTSLQSRYNTAVNTWTNKADKSSLGTQVVFTLSGSDLYITTK